MKPDDPGENAEFDNLNLEGILDEALRVEEQKAAEESLRESPSHETGFGVAPEGEASSGILEEALGLGIETGPVSPPARESEHPIIENPLTADEPPFAPEESPLGQEEVDLLEDRFSQLSASPEIAQGPSLDDMARTQIANDIEGVLELSTPEIKKEITSPEVNVPEIVEIEAQAGVAGAHEVEVPVRLSLSPDADEVELKVTLVIKINRQKNR
jgi:hypothetical protein